MRVAHYLVGEEGDLCNFSGLGIGEEEPPMKAVVVVKVDQVELISLCGGLCVGEQVLATLGKAQEDMPCCQC